MSARRLLFCLGLVAAIVAAAFLRAETTAVAPASPSLDSDCCAVRLSEVGGTFDLAVDSGNRYELIVSSLGDASQTNRVQLESHPSGGVEICATISIESLRRQSVGWAVRTKARRAELPMEMVGTAHPTIPSISNCHPDSPCAGASRWSRPGNSDLATPRRFFLHVTASSLEDLSGYVPVTGELVGEGENVRIYVDAEQSPARLARGLVSETIRLLDHEIIPHSRQLLGEHADVDGDGKLAVLITPWLGRLCGGQTSLNGCVRANDFQTGVESPYGNSADVLYLNSHLEPGPALKTLLAHEYTHAVCFSRRFARDGGPLPVEDDWLNEAIAHVAENLHETGWSNLEERIASYLAAPQNSPLVVSDYYRAGLWRDSGCRGATYLFLRFCVDRFGEGLLGDLVNSPRVGPRNIEQATGMPFHVLFRHWTIALARDEIASIPLDSTLGSRQLNGVKRIVWRIDEAPCEIDVRGTATSVIRLEPTTSGARHIVVRNPPGARLQVTLLRRLDCR